MIKYTKYILATGVITGVLEVQSEADALASITEDEGIVLGVGEGGQLDDFIVVDGEIVWKSEPELALLNEERTWAEIRKRRDMKLQATDYTQLQDSDPAARPIWAAIRQGYRDIPLLNTDPYNYDEPLDWYGFAAFFADPIMTKDVVEWEGANYRSLVDYNVWSPTRNPANWELVV